MHFGSQLVKVAPVGNRIHPEYQIHGAQRGEQFQTDELSQPTLEPIAIDRGVLVLGHYEPDAGIDAKRSDGAHIHGGCAHSLPLVTDQLEFVAARQSLRARERAGLRRLRTWTGSAR